MGIFTSHIHSTMGTSAADTAEAEAKTLFNEAIALMGARFDGAVADPFAARDLAAQFLASVKNGGGMNFSGKPAAQPIGMLGGGDSTHDDSTDKAEPSEAEKLGAELLKLAGNKESEAIVLLKLLETVTSADRSLTALLMRTIEQVSNGARVVNHKGVLMLDSTQSATEGQDAFYQLIQTVHGATVDANQPVRSLLKDANDELRKKKTETDALKLRLSEVIAEIERKTSVKPNADEPLKDYVNRAIDALASKSTGGGNTEVVKLLDEIAKIVGVDRGTKDDTAYRAAVIQRVESAMLFWRSDSATWKRLAQVARHNGIDHDKDITTKDLLNLLLENNKGMGNKIKVPSDS